MTRISELCVDCVLYDVSCDSSTKYDEFIRDGKPRCANRDKGEEPDESNIQVKGFHSLYRAKRNNDVSSLLAFVEAIVQTSDDVFRKAQKNKSELIEQVKSI